LRCDSGARTGGCVESGRWRWPARVPCVRATCEARAGEGRLELPGVAPVEGAVAEALIGDASRVTAAPSNRSEWPPISFVAEWRRRRRRAPAAVWPAASRRYCRRRRQLPAARAMPITAARSTTSSIGFVGTRPTPVRRFDGRLQSGGRQSASGTSAVGRVPSPVAELFGTPSRRAPAQRRARRTTARRGSRCWRERTRTRRRCRPRVSERRFEGAQPGCHPGRRWIAAVVIGRCRHEGRVQRCAGARSGRPATTAMVSGCNVRASRLPGSRQHRRSRRPRAMAAAPRRIRSGFDTCGVDQPERGPLHGNAVARPRSRARTRWRRRERARRVDGIRQEREDVRGAMTVD